MKIEEFVLNHPQRLDDLKAWIKNEDVIDIKYSCCCDATGTKITTCVLVLYNPKPVKIKKESK